MKYILVTGGVISGVGKGVIASSFGTILKSCGINVTSIKIDPYINIDAGTFSPYEHGEVYVLDDGGEVDLDLGNYERFLGITLHRDNNITTGTRHSASACACPFGLLACIVPDSFSELFTSLSNYLTILSIGNAGS